MSGVWREPSTTTEDYPGLAVCDGRVTGSITLGRSRLPIWAFIGRLAQDGWQVTDDWDDLYGWDAEKMDAFLYELMEQRGEFARLICILADVERRDRSKGFGGKPWWETKSQRSRVMKQLERCLAVLAQMRAG